MKKLKNILLFAMVLCLAAGFAAAGQTGAAEELTATRAIMINDYQVVIEFSEPIVFNLNGNSAGPWISIRVVSDVNNTLLWKGEPNGQTENDVALQWGGAVNFTDSKHDKLIFTMAPDKFGVTNLSDILGFRGELAPWAGNLVRISIEEIPFNKNVPANDGYIDNITTLDGKTLLSANKPDGWCGQYLPLETDDSYEIDLSHLEPTGNVPAITGDALAPGTASAAQDEVIRSVDVLNTVLVVGGALVIAVAVCLLLGFIIKKAKKGGEAK